MNVCFFLGKLPEQLLLAALTAKKVDHRSQESSASSLGSYLSSTEGAALMSTKADRKLPKSRATPNTSASSWGSYLSSN